MKCEQAQQLFDAYLDGQLSASQQTELGAHRLHCADCRRALALLEVSGHVLATDRDPVKIGDQFSDRLTACMDVRQAKWSHRLPKFLYVAVPIAAAAVIALAFMGVFDSGGPSEVAGHKEVRYLDSAGPADIDAILRDLDRAAGGGAGVDFPNSPAPWLLKVEDNVGVLQQSSAILQQLPLSLLEPLEQLNDAKDGGAEGDANASDDVEAHEPSSEDAETDVADDGQP